MESYFLEAPVDGQEEKRWEIPLVVRLDDMTGKHRDRKGISMEQAQVLVGEGKVLPKRKCPALKSSLASTGLK